MLEASSVVEQLDLATLPQTAAALAATAEHHQAFVNNPTAPPQQLLDLAKRVRKQALHVEIVARPLEGPLREHYLTSEKRAGVLTNLLHYNRLTDTELEALFERGVVSGKVASRVVVAYGFPDRFASQLITVDGRTRLEALGCYGPTLDDTAAAAAIADGYSWLGRPFTDMGLYVKAAMEIGPATRSAVIADGQHPAIVASGAAHRAFTLDEQLRAARLTLDGELTEAGERLLTHRLEGTGPYAGTAKRTGTSRMLAVNDVLSAAWTALVYSPWTYPQVLDAVQTAARRERDHDDVYGSAAEMYKLLDGLSRRRQYQGSARIEPDPAAFTGPTLRWVVRRASDVKRFPEIALVAQAAELIRDDATAAIGVLASERLAFCAPRLRPVADALVERFELHGTYAEQDAASIGTVSGQAAGKIVEPDQLRRATVGTVRDDLDRLPLRSLWGDNQAAAVVELERRIGDNPAAWLTLLSLLADLGDLTVPDVAVTASSLAA